MIPLSPGARVQFVYTNYRGEEGTRRVQVIGVEWGRTSWHPDPQALLWALDLDKHEERLFAIQDIRNLCSMD